MSPTIAEAVLGISTAVLVFLYAVRVFPGLIRRIARYLAGGFDDDRYDWEQGE